MDFFIFVTPNATLGLQNAQKVKNHWGYAPDPAGGTYSASIDPLAGFGWDRDFQNTRTFDISK